MHCFQSCAKLLLPVDLMEYIPLCLWTIRKQIACCPSGTTALLYFGIGTYMFWSFSTIIEIVVVFDGQ